MKQPPELFAVRPVRSEFMQQRAPRRGLRRRLLLGLIVIVLAGVAGLVYQRFFPDNSQPAEIPTIKAEGTLKQRPEQPGGIEIPHQDEQVFQQLDNSAAGAKTVEHLLPPPEVPQAAPAPVAATPVTPTSQPQTAPVPVAAPAGAVTAAPVPQEIKPVTPPSTTPMVATTVQPAKPTPAPAAKTAAKPMVVGSIPKEMFTGEVAKPAKGFLVQLASFPDQQVALGEMKRMQSKYADTLGTVHLHLTKADLGSKGIYYRVQSDPLTDAQAHSICTALGGKKASCIIVRQ
jgi:cell division protein FtsN